MIVSIAPLFSVIRGRISYKMISWVLRRTSIYFFNQKITVSSFLVSIEADLSFRTSVM